MGMEVFDLDGTLTEDFNPGVGDKTGYGLGTYSLWNLITAELVEDARKFDKKAKAWKKYVTEAENVDKVLSSEQMTEVGIRMFPEKHQNSTAIRDKAVEITEHFFARGVIYTKAIEYLRHRLEQGVTCVISTASYEEGAIGFVRGLVKCCLLTQSLADKIVVCGTQIDWARLCVVHMNVDENKLRGLERALHEPIGNIRPRITVVFGDDPAINDRSLLEQGKYSFVIINHKNQNAILPDNCVLSQWPDIFSYRDQLEVLHARLMQEKQSSLRDSTVAPASVSKSFS